MTDPATSSSTRARLVRAAVYLVVIAPLVYEVQYLWRKGPLIEPVPITPKTASPDAGAPASPAPAVPLPPQVTAVQEAPAPEPEDLEEPVTAEPEPATAPGPLPKKDMVKLQRMLAAASHEGEVRQHKKLETPATPAPVSGKKSLESFRDCEQCPLMVVMPTSRFNMGSSDGNPWEQPRHSVNIRHRFAIGRYEISERMWAACVADQYCKAAGTGGTLPVVKVSWDDAGDYTKWLSGKTGRRYRLPTEAEWALAARGGSTTSRFWGPDRENQCLYANGADQALKKISRLKTEFAQCNDRVARRAPVGSYKPNAFSLRDTAGNVWEWVQDCWQPSYNGAPDDGSAHEATGICQERVIRGGSWRMRPEALRSSERGHALPGQRSDDLGFRVVAE